MADDLGCMNSYRMNASIQWKGDLDCDGISEFIVHYEADLTNYYRLFKQDSIGDYRNIVTSSTYWEYYSSRFGRNHK